MLRLLIIDDIFDKLIELKTNLENSTANKVIDWKNSICKPTVLADEETGYNYNYSEQVERITKIICDNWDNFDLLLLDWSLWGQKDEDDPISMKVLSQLFKDHSNYCDVIKNEKKFILVVTGKNSRNLNFDLNEIGSKIICIDKPMSEERLINMSSCRCVPGTFTKCCALFKYNSSEKCNKNSCLAQIITAIDSILFEV